MVIHYVLHWDRKECCFAYIAFAFYILLTHLETDQSEYGEDEGCENDDIPQILHREDDGVHDGLEAGDDGDRLEGAEHPERAQRPELAEVHHEGDVAHADHHEVEPVPGVPHVGEPVQREPAGQQLHR